MSIHVRELSIPDSSYNPSWLSDGRTYSSGSICKGFDSVTILRPIKYVQRSPTAVLFEVHLMDSKLP